MTRFFVPGTPAPQGSKTHVGGGRMRESSKAVAGWRDAVKVYARAAGFRGYGTEQPVAVRVRFLFPRRGTPATSTRLPTSPPDLDKLVRAVLDALTGVAYVDDAQVVSIYAGKEWTAGDEGGADVAVDVVG